MRHIILNLSGPMMSFGAVVIDHLYPTHAFPMPSTLTGMVANALGWQRVDGKLLNDLQERMVFAARMDREMSGNGPLIDYHVSQLDPKDVGWTTYGQPEGRTGATGGSHLSWREYLSDARLTVALRLTSPGARPTLTDVARALERPERPLYIGRKCCLPAGPIYGGFQEADSCLGALLSVPIKNEKNPTSVRVQWMDADRPNGLSDSRELEYQGGLRMWESRMHGGIVRMRAATIPASRFVHHEIEEEPS